MSFTSVPLISAMFTMIYQAADISPTVIIILSHYDNGSTKKIQSYLNISEKSITKVPGAKSDKKSRLTSPHTKEDKVNPFGCYWKFIMDVLDVLIYKQSELISKCRYKSWYTVRIIKWTQELVKWQQLQFIHTTSVCINAATSVYT